MTRPRHQETGTCSPHLALGHPAPRLKISHVMRTRRPQAALPQTKTMYVLITYFHESWIFCVIASDRKWYFVTKIVLTYCEKKLFLWSRKTFVIRGWRSRICKIFEITRKIYSNSERSEQSLATECVFNFFLKISHI